MNQNKVAQFEDIAKLFRVLGHPARLAMIEELSERSWCVCEIAAHLGLTNPTASKHLSLLKSVGVIEMQKEGTQVNCTLTMPCIFQMMACATQFNSVAPKSEGLLSNRTACAACENKVEAIIK
ncbi:MAG: metalloregulator ArsR/SmtB family transcription factor [Sphaerochaetaceae bacterium]|nr:metalloregulator ArsR/SmtB family transcription factor [Sphaerochaetaceae bacterium]MDD4219772.1 metalloregulator ArsR/SmtB family transcription factor [Sphaerochaetaceae bacterium]